MAKADSGQAAKLYHSARRNRIKLERSLCLASSALNLVYSLRYLCVLCAFCGESCTRKAHRRDAEAAETPQRRA